MSAWYTKYRTEFTDIIGGIAWKVDIQEYLSSDPGVTDLTATGDPLHIEWDADDTFNNPICPSKANINVWSTTDFSLVTLCSDEDFHYKVLIYAGTDTFWQGFIVTGEYQEPYDQPPYPVQIVAVDGLHYLKNLLFKYQTTDPDDTYYNGRTLESGIISIILAKIQITTFHDYINIFETTMEDSYDDSPFDQTQIDVDIFKDMYCWEVITEILKKYNAVIRQVPPNPDARPAETVSKYVVYRPLDLVNSVVYGRVFTSAIAKTSTDATPGQNIRRTGDISNLWQMPDSTLMIKRPAKKITMNQDYEYKESWIDNWEFKPETYNGTNFDFWTKSDAGSDLKQVSELVPGEKLGMAFKDDSTANVLSQQFGQNSIISTIDFFVLEFEYAYYNTGSVATALTLLRIDQGAYGLSEVDAATAEWDNSSPPYIYFNESVAAGWTTWRTYKRTITSLKENGYINIEILPPDVNGIYICYRNIKFYATSTKTFEKQVKRKFRERITGGYGGEFQIKGKYYTVQYREEAANIVEHNQIIRNSINGAELEFDYILGDIPNVSDPVSDRDVNIDNILEQFAGSMAIAPVEYRVDEIDLSSTISAGTADVTCNGLTKVATKSYAQFLTDVAHDFVTSWLADYAAIGITLSHTNDILIFTGDTLGVEFTGSTTITNLTGTLSGVPNTITLGHPLTIAASTAWNTKSPGSENAPLLEIIGEETANQYSRPKELLQLNIYEADEDKITLNMQGILTDILNEVSVGTPRTFIFNSGELDAMNRIWRANMIEII